ncbi:MAX gene-associated protein isoform X2 [Talpa occidentalis]|uniref:MAX gene-associated protein isoform X2 n=1 Tax=Talpa occidentalis TaxID=50954 RepID=UPI00188F3815|nr:MAX gene-associated protein isoform X2 [Talpa occidentalis]
MEEKQQIILANQDGGSVAGAAPTFFVILKQPGNGKTDQGILVTNRDACALASSVSSSGKSKGKICLPADCTVGGITVTLDNNSMWNEFYHRSTEMILTKQGRRMFPYCRYWITGLDSNMKYILVMDISPVDNHRYKWNGRWWEPSGKAEPHVLGRVFIHPESPSTGHYWMHQPVSFYKLKLTNNTLDQEGHIILHSMHRYLPRLHLVPAEKATEVIQLNGPGVHTFTFPQTEFFAVTAYQNIQITQLKIDYNPFAKGFRDDGLNSKPQRDGKQKNNSDQEGTSVPSSPGPRVRLTEGEGSEMPLSDSDSLLRSQETSGKGLEKPALNIKGDFLDFMDIDSALEVPQLKQEVSESLVANNFEDSARVASSLDPNGSFNVVIKEEPLDDYEYELGECPEGVTVKQEETDEETDVYSNSDDDPILEKQLKRHNKVDNLEADHQSSKWLPNSPSGVAKAKMFKLDAGKMPVVYLEPCAVTKSTVKISELPDNMLSPSRKDKSMLTELDYLPAYIDNNSETGFCSGKESENDLRKHSPDLRVVHKYPSFKEHQWKYPDLSDSNAAERILDCSKSSAGDSFLGKEDLGRKRTTMLKISASSKVVNVSQNASPTVPGKRGRPRKLKLSKAGRPPKNTGKSLTSTRSTPLGPGSTFPDVKPDLEDVDGVLFVSFESKEALDIHAVDGTTEEPSSLQTPTTNDAVCRARISQLEKELIEDLKTLRHKQVIHPGLQEVGLKLNSVDPTMSIDLKYLGVQLPLAPANSFPFWNLTGTNPASPDAGFPFVSRTGKTNDFTKIKGWRGKFHSASASRTEGGNSESSLKNRSAFCSDKLDEYLENEGKLMETSMGFSSNAPTSPVVYQLPTKSTSYVRTLDSVLKKQSTISPSTSYSLKPHSVPLASRKGKSQNKQATLSGRTKSSYKSILPYPVSPKQKQTHMSPGDKVTKNSSSTVSENQGNNFVVSSLDESVFPKQISLRQAHQQQQQQQQGTRPPGLSKSQVKLMDLEDCALWEGKPRTYITEERADVSLTTLLTAQASLKTKPIHTIIRKRAPPCNNDFCRLGCVCSSLALEKRQPAHCRRPDCMFGCTCLKRKVVLVKGGSKPKHFQRKAAQRDPLYYDTLGEEQREEGEEGVKEEEEQLKEKKKRKKLEYTICETEPEQPVRHYPLWVKVEGEVDPEPVYIPTPSVIEPMKPLLLPQPEVLSTTVKGKPLTGIKPARAYTPKPNPVIREEDKDPVYLYFESMMTCARVRVYERKKEEQRQPSPSPTPSLQQQDSCHSSPENCSAKEPEAEHQSLKPITCDLEDDSDKSQEKSWKSSCNEGESSSTSYMHQRSPGGPTKLIEIISDCNWEEDRNKILSILSQHINSNMPQSLKVGSFIIELASQRKSRGEKNPPVYSSRVKISMPSCQDQDCMAEKSGSETPDGPLSPGKMDDISPMQTDALDSVRERLHGGKGLPFYAGLSPAGKLVACRRKPSSSTSGLIQVNGKSYPQAKLLLGQMGALHPANRLAAYITGRLRPSVLDLSTLSTVISKVASNAKVAASRKPRTLLPSTSNSKSASSSGTTTNRPGKNLKAFVPAKRPIAARPSPGGVFTQFVMSKVGALQQKIPGVSTPQPLTGPQKFSIRPSPVMVVTPVVSSEPVQVCSPVTAAVTTTTPQVFLENVTAVTPMTAISDVGAKEPTYSSGATITGVVEVSETNTSTPVTPTQSTATVNLIKTTGITTPVASVAFPKSLVASSPTITLPVASTASTSIVVVTTAASSSMVTTPTSSLGSVPIILSGIDGSPPVSQRPENAPQIPVATPQISPNTVKRAGPRLLLIPVQQGSPTLRPVPNTQLQGHRMVLQPVRSPSGMNLFRHPNGQIVQLLPLHQLRGSTTQPNLQPVMFRNPGSVMGIRLPTPSKPSETPSSSASSSFSVMNPVIQAVGSSPAMNVITQAPSLLSSGPSFVSQSSTLTLRISPPEPQSFPSKTGSETKIACSSAGQSVGTASLIPLQSGSFALLQLPGQKPVPSSVLQHVASLQMKRESQNADQKEEMSFLKREQENKKTLQSGEEAIDTEANKMKQNSGATASEETLNDSLEDGGNHVEEESLTEEDPASVKPSERSYITRSHIGEDYKDVDEEYGIRNHNSSKEKLIVLDVKTISEKASSTTAQGVSNAQPKKLGDMKVEQQKELNDSEEKSNEFPLFCKEENELELSRTRVTEQKSNSQPQAKEKGCDDSLEKDSDKEKWRKHHKDPLTQKCVETAQECKEEADEQLIKETKTCQENADMLQQEQGISDFLGKSGTTLENARVLKTECDSWSRVSSPAAFSLVPRRTTKGRRGEGHFQGDVLLPGEQIQPKQEKKGGRSSTDFPVLDLEEEDEDDENEKTDDSIDEIVDVVSDYQSEEVDDVEKNNCVEYIEDDEEQVDIETVEELSEEINATHMKTTTANTQTFKQPCRASDEKAAEKSRKTPPVPIKLKPEYWSEKLQKEAEAYAYYRRTHTANERRRRGEMRDLFEKLKTTLGLLHSSKVSKSLILTRAFSEIQGLTDQADKLIGQKNLLTRKRNILIRKVSSLSGKTEEVVLKKLEYIYAKQQALEAQKRKKKMGSDEFDVSPRTSKQQEGSSPSSVDLGQMFINNRKGKPLILSRKRDQATENTSPSDTPHTSANIVMTPQGQLLTLKGPLFPGPVVTVSPALLETDLKPQVPSSAVAQSENDDLFMMPRIVNVTSLATEGDLVDMGGSRYPHEVPDGKPPDLLKNTVKNEDNSFEESGRLSSRGNHRDGRMALGSTQVFLANKDSGFPQIVDVSSMQEAQEFLPKKTSGDLRGIQYKWKESESRRERLKSKESSFHKLKMKDLKDSSIEMELRKVASAIEEAALDPSELLTNMEDEDDTDETLTSLLNEIAFLNQQLNDDSVNLAELPNSMETEFPGDTRRAFISKLPPGNRATFQVGHLGTDLKELSDVQGESDSVSPLLLHLEDDDFSENEKQLGEPASEPDVLKIVIDSEIKDSLLSHRKASDGGKSTSGIPGEPESVSSPPILHMKAGLENNSTDTLWRPMPKLAPLGLKVANPPSDADGQSLKVMPCLAPVAAKVGSIGQKMNLAGNDQECRENKVMPTLAPVVAKMGNSGASPSSAGK